MNYFLARQPGTTITNGLRTFDVDSEGFTIPATRTWRFNDVALRFASGAQFTVNGTLIADGMIFTASSAAWGGFRISGADGVSIYDSYIEDATTGINAQNTNGLYVSGTTITGSTNYALHASSITGSEIIDTRFENSGAHGVYITSGGLRLVGARIEDNGSDGIHLSYANTLLMGGGGEPGYNVATGNSGHGLYAYASSANLGEAPTVANPDGYAGYNSIYGNTGEDVYATSSSDVMAEENWWGESPPNTSHFYVSSNSSFDYAPWLTSDPNAGFGKAAYTSLETSGTASRTGQDEAAYPSGSNTVVDVRAAESSIGAFVGSVQALREKQGRAHAAAVLAEIAATPGHPMATVAQLLRLGDLLYLRRTQEVVAAGETLLRQELDVEAQKIVARALLTAYWEQLGDETNAARMKGLLVRFGDLAATSGTLAPEIEAAAYAIKAARASEVASGKTEAMTVDGRLRVSTHPNPFNRELMIRYVLPEQGHVTLGLFDVTGRRVALLVDEAQAEGEHEAAFDAGELPSGVYLYRITTAGGTTSGVVLLTK